MRPPQHLSCRAFVGDSEPAVNGVLSDKRMGIAGVAEANCADHVKRLIVIRVARDSAPREHGCGQ